MNYLITGNAGSGKSTIIGELQKRGYTAYDTDDLPALTHKVPPKNPNGMAYSIEWDAAELQKLLESAATVFIGGSVSNQSDFYSLFDAIFAVHVDVDTLEHRLITRINNSTGKNDSDRAFLLSIQDRIYANLANAGAIQIDNTRSLSMVVNTIVEIAHL